MTDWTFPNITDYWDERKQAVHNYSQKLAGLSDDDLAGAIREIRESIGKHVEALPEQKLLTLASVVVDDLYRAASHLPVWNDSVSRYLEASAALFFELLKKRGYVVHYLVSHLYGEADEFASWQRPMELLPHYYTAAGLDYIFAPLLSLGLMFRDEADPESAISRKGKGVNPETANEFYPSYKEEAHGGVDGYVEECHRERRGYILLDVEENPALFERAGKMMGQPGVITVIRESPPMPGTEIRVGYPKAPFEA